ncbi:IS630 family transposase [Deinococcus sp. Arct2-2]|uniref:IS630 family transposase n=1 Tax=Deinococcus sp. Arct2-2 TaxID=2568653 RepID=UPI001454D8BC|nr:IS630 family transposase [Deinococcus sp. Arct2-2]
MGLLEKAGVHRAGTASDSCSGSRAGGTGDLDKKVEAALRTARAAYPEKQVRLWVQDEGRFGLKPVLKRLWALRGQRPVIAQRRRYQWLYTYIFVEPLTGQSDFLIFPSVSVPLMQVALDEFSRAVDPHQQQLIVLLLDQAGWHTSQKLEVPPNLFLLPFPAYTPELSPAEPMVTKLKLPIANQTLNTLQEVEDLIAAECVRLQHNPQEVKSLTLFPWIKHVLDSF